MDNRLREMTDRVEDIGSTGSSNEKVFFDPLADETRAAVSILRVSSNS